MAHRSYVDIQDIKNELGITTATSDTLLRKIGEAGTALIENFTHRKFYVEHATKYYTGANKLWLNDILSVSTIKLDEDANGSFEVTLTTSDYVLFPLNDYPKTYMEVTEYGDYGTFAYGVKKGVEVVGEFGFGDGESSTPYIAESTNTSSVAASASTINVVSTNLAAGQTWLIDSEQFYVTALSGSVATIIPSMNGTSATTHAASSDIYIYQYPSDIWNACLTLAVEEYQNRAKRGMKSEALGDYRYSLDNNAVNSILVDSIPPSYRKMRF